jgi:hypothetical protein
MMATVTGGFDSIAYFSVNNGLSWSTGTPFTIVSADAQISIAVSSTGGSGSMSRYATNYNTAGRKFANMSGGDWSVTGLIPTSAGSADGESLRCVGALIFGAQSVFCGPDQTLTTTYRYFTHSGAAAPVLGASVIPPNGLTNAQGPDFTAVGFNSSTAYVLGRNSASTAVNVWITKDNFGSVFQIGTLTPATALIGGCCRGDMHSRNGKIYFSNGVSGSNAFLGVIQ